MMGASTYCHISNVGCPDEVVLGTAKDIGTDVLGAELLGTAEVGPTDVGSEVVGSVLGIKVVGFA